MKNSNYNTKNTDKVNLRHANLNFFKYSCKPHSPKLRTGTSLGVFKNYY